MKPALNTLIFSKLVHQRETPKHRKTRSRRSPEAMLRPSPARWLLNDANNRQESETMDPSRTSIHAIQKPSKLFHSTTSFLTTANLTYAIGAGITAGAGTRLVLQLFLVGYFKPYSFRMWIPYGIQNGISCHYLFESKLGNLRACCFPWEW